MHSAIHELFRLKRVVTLFGFKLFCIFCLGLIESTLKLWINIYVMINGVI